MPELSLEAEYPRSDMPVKFRDLFRRDFEVIAQTGQVPVKLFGTLLVFRARLPADTQEIEGANSILKAMAQAHMGRPDFRGAKLQILDLGAPVWAGFGRKVIVGGREDGFRLTGPSARAVQSEKSPVYASLKARTGPNGAPRPKNWPNESLDGPYGRLHQLSDTPWPVIG